MKRLDNCINCGGKWDTLIFSASNKSDGLTLASYWCSTCNEQTSIISEDKSA